MCRQGVPEETPATDKADGSAVGSAAAAMAAALAAARDPGSQKEEEKVAAVQEPCGGEEKPEAEEVTVCDGGSEGAGDGPSEEVQAHGAEGEEKEETEGGSEEPQKLQPLRVTSLPPPPPAQAKRETKRSAKEASEHPAAADIRSLSRLASALSDADVLAAGSDLAVGVSGPRPRWQHLSGRVPPCRRAALTFEQGAFSSPLAPLARPLSSPAFLLLPLLFVPFPSALLSPVCPPFFLSTPPSPHPSLLFLSPLPLCCLALLPLLTSPLEAHKTLPKLMGGTQTILVASKPSRALTSDPHGAWCPPLPSPAAALSETRAIQEEQAEASRGVDGGELRSALFLASGSPAEAAATALALGWAAAALLPHWMAPSAGQVPWAFDTAAPAQPLQLQDAAGLLEVRLTGGVSRHTESSPSAPPSPLSSPPPSAPPSFTAPPPPSFSCSLLFLFLFSTFLPLAPSYSSSYPPPPPSLFPSSPSSCCLYFSYIFSCPSCSSSTSLQHPHDTYAFLPHPHPPAPLSLLLLLLPLSPTSSPPLPLPLLLILVRT